MKSVILKIVRGGTFGAAYLFFAFLACLTAAAHAAEPRFCVVPVLNGKPTKADVGDAHRMTYPKHEMPWLPSILFMPVNRGGQWLVDKDRRYSAVQLPFPDSYLDSGRWVEEPGTKRIIATPFWHTRPAILALNQGAPQFEELRIPSNPGMLRFSNPIVFEPTGEVLLTSSAGTIFVVKGAEVAPWPHSALLSNRFSTWREMAYSRELQALVIAEPDGDGRSSRLFVIQDGAVTNLGKFAAAGVRLSDIEGAASSLIIGATKVARIDRHDRGARPAHFSLQPLLAEPIPPISPRLFYSKLHKAHFYFGPAGLAKEDAFTSTADGIWVSIKNFLARSSAANSVAYLKEPIDAQWYRVTREGIIAIPGGTRKGIVWTDFETSKVVDFADLSETFAISGDVLSVFDGATLSIVPETKHQSVGKPKQFAGQTTIGRALFATHSAVFALSKERATKLEAPGLILNDYELIAMKDWPTARVVLVATTRGLVAVDENLGIQVVSSNIEFTAVDNFVAQNPESGDMIMTTKDRIVVVVDTLKHGRDICSRPAD